MGYDDTFTQVLRWGVYVILAGGLVFCVWVTVDGWTRKAVARRVAARKRALQITEHFGYAAPFGTFCPRRPFDWAESCPDLR